MNNDLISREALKKAIDDAYEEYDGYDPHDLSRFAERVEDLIDNAPTVDIKDEIAGAYNEGYMCGNKEAEKARPQAFINGIVELISKNGITTVDELLEALKGGAE